MYICICMYIFTYTYRCLSIYLYISIHVHIHVWVHMEQAYTSMYIYIYLYLPAPWWYPQWSHASARCHTPPAPRLQAPQPRHPDHQKHEQPDRHITLQVKKIPLSSFARLLAISSDCWWLIRQTSIELAHSTHCNVLQTLWEVSDMLGDSYNTAPGYQTRSQHIATRCHTIRTPQQLRQQQHMRCLTCWATVGDK